MKDESGVRNNVASKRFELETSGRVAFLDYMQAGSNITYTHTEVPPELEGQGLGSSLARYALDYARENNLKIIPICPFVTSYLKRHPEYHSLVFGYKGSE